MSQLIEEVRKRPHLYDVTVEDYKDSGKKDNSWAEIAQILNSDTITLKRDWKRLRDCFRQAILRRAAEGQDVKNMKPWRYEKEMQFLLPSMTSRTNRVSHSQIDLEGSSEPSEPMGGHDLDRELLREVNPRSIKRKAMPEVDRFLEYLEESQRSLTQLDDLDLFFASACQSTRKLPRRLQNQVKKELLDTIMRAEEQFEDVEILEIKY